MVNSRKSSSTPTTTAEIAANALPLLSTGPAGLAVDLFSRTNRKPSHIPSAINATGIAVRSRTVDLFISKVVHVGSNALSSSVHIQVMQSELYGGDKTPKRHTLR
jgi:hypothetical protein